MFAVASAGKTLINHRFGWINRSARKLENVARRSLA
jgi:hypothetical protein